MQHGGAVRPEKDRLYFCTSARRFSAASACFCLSSTFSMSFTDNMTNPKVKTRSHVRRASSPSAGHTYSCHKVCGVCLCHVLVAISKKR